jgi:CubicO group peptidase (beta-lactamase class C family)
VTLTAASSLERRLSERLDDALDRHGVPGAVVGIGVGDEVAVASAGVRNVGTGDAVGRDSMFLIGSVTKVLQATLLVSLGLPLDDAVRCHLPEFRCADPEARDAITIRQLLDHSSGLEGDHFPELGWGDDAVARLVESCADLGQLHPPGLLATYCNTGVNVGGRIVEVETGRIWDDAIRDRLFAPAGMERTVSLPWEAILRDVAVGHVPGNGGPVVAPAWSWPRSMAPAGGTLAASASDLLRFARLHLERAAPVGEEVADAMTEFQRPWPTGIAAPGPPLAGMGLGWFMWDWTGTRVIGHDGAGFGSAASLRLVPAHDVAVVSLANSWYDGYALTGELVRGILEDEVGLVSAGEPAAGCALHQPAGYVGTYRRLGSEIEVTAHASGGLIVRQRQELPHDSSESVTESALEPIGPDLFRARNPAYAYDRNYRFVATAGSRPDFLYQGIRAHRRDAV